MERAWQRKSKIPTITEGNRQFQKQKTAPKLASESSSCIRGTTKEDLCISEVGRSSSKRGTGMPMKKLLAEEISKETEGKRRSPSVIARLMGLDGLPSPQPVHKNKKSLSDNYQHRTASIGSQRNRQLNEGRSNRKSSMEQEEFKDVYEDLEASHVSNRRYSSKWTDNSKLMKPEMTFVQHKFLDATHLSTRETVQGSKEFHDTFEILDSNKDLRLKFLPQPDYLFVRHLHDLQGAPSSSMCSHLGVLKPSNSAKYEASAKGWKSERETSRRHGVSSHWKHEDGLLSHSYNSLGVHISPKSSKIRLEAKDESEIFSTRIVILKPNLGRNGCSAVRSVSSPDSSHVYMSDGRKHTEFLSVGTGDTGSWGKKDSSNVVGFSGPKSREAREISKEITRQMRDTFGSGMINSGIRGYAGDESSYNMSGSDSSSESEGMTLPSRNSFDWNNRHKRSKAGSTESSVSREAKKRLSERWKMTHRYQDVGVVGKNSTLGEMLAIPDGEMRRENLDDMMGLAGTSDGFARNNRTAGWDSPPFSPLGISSRDGWKDGYIRNSTRSRSLPPLSFGSENYRTSAQREALVDGRLLMPKEAMNQGRIKLVKGNFNQKEDFSSKNLRSSNKKSQSSRHRYAWSADSLPDINFSQNQMEIKKDPSEEHPVVSQTPCSITSTRCVVDKVVNTEHGSLTMSSEELLATLSAPMLGNDNSSAHDEDDSNPQEPSIGPSKGVSVALQCPGPEPESSESSKEADHPSPVSVLEVPSTEDVSSGSDCFERVSADLHDLRMQLQLLKMESKAYAEVPLLISNDEDIGQGSIIVSEERGIVRSESWESSYLVDVLIDSGFNDTDPDKFITTWHSLDCPMGHWIFDDLEKKYCDETSGLRSERRLLFDRINSAFLEIFERFLESCLRVKPVMAKHGVNDELQKVLVSQEKAAYEDVSEKVLDREMHWLYSSDDVHVVGMEIEKLLIDDLVTEVVTM